MPAPPVLEERLRAAADAMPEAPVEIERVLSSARRRRLWGAVGLLAVAAGLVVLLSIGGEAAKRALNATVPDARGRGEAQAVAEVKAADLRPEVVNECPAGVGGCVVIDQEPESGKTVEPQSGVVLTVGKLVKVPKVLLMRRADAFRKLEERRLVARASRSCGAPICLVSAQDPEPATETSAGSIVELRLSPRTEVPRLNGLSESDAREKLKLAGLQNVSPTAGCPEETTCKVSYQAPKAEKVVRLDARVMIGLDVQVPKVVGQTVRDARERLEAAGLSINEKGRCAEGSPCSVVTQIPSANRFARRGTRVTITKRAQTPVRILVPAVVGLAPDEAERLIESRKLEPRPSGRCSGNLPCKIVKQDPEPRTRVKPGTPVVIEASRVATVPKVRGETEADAIELIEAEGLVARPDPTCPDSVTECVAIEPRPAAGKEIRIGSEVKLILGARVPELEHEKKDEAKATLEKAGLRLTSTGDCNTDKHCRVVKQDPPAGKLVDLFDEVTIEIGDRVQVPDVEGDSKADAVSTLRRAGLTHELDDSKCKSGADCVVDKQDPPAGTWLDPETPVTLTLIPAATE